MDGGAPSPERPLGSRQRLVDAAVQLAVEHHESGAGLREVFGHLTPSLVAERAGLSRGLIYHHWGDPDSDRSDAFGRFLVAVSDELFELAAVPEDLGELADQLPDNFADVVVILTAFEQERYAGEGGARFRTSQALTIHGAWPEDGAESVLVRLEALYRRLGEKLGREPVPPLTYADVAFAVMAAFDGFALFHNIYPERTFRSYDWQPDEPSTDPCARWTLAAITIESILANMTRPATAPMGPAQAAGRA